MIKKFKGYEFNYHPRKLVPFELPDIHAPRELSDVYDSYSAAKAQACEFCLDMFRELDGFGWSIVSHNSMTFSVGFYFRAEDGCVYCAHITRDYNHLYMCRVDSANDRSVF